MTIWIYWIFLCCCWAYSSSIFNVKRANHPDEIGKETWRPSSEGFANYVCHYRDVSHLQLKKMKLNLLYLSV